MALLNSNLRYGSLSLALHWLTAVLIVAVYVLMELHEAFGRTPAGRAMEEWHSMVGLLILLLTVLRLGLRFMQPTPAIAPPLVAWQQRAAQLFHVALYLWLLAMPLLGWLLLSAEGHDISFFGLPLPGLTAGNRDLAGRVKEIHETIGTLGYVLIGAHTAAALFHHHVQKDNTLLRMLPQRR